MKGDDLLIYAYSTATQTVAPNALVTYAASTRCGNRATLAAGTGAVQLNCPGAYRVAANVDAAPIAAGLAGIELRVNGVALPGAEASATVAAAGDVANLKFSALVVVPQGCCSGVTLPVALTVAATETSQTLTVTNAAITVS